MLLPSEFQCSALISFAAYTKERERHAGKVIKALRRDYDLEKLDLSEQEDGTSLLVAMTRDGDEAPAEQCLAEVKAMITDAEVGQVFKQARVRHLIASITATIGCHHQQHLSQPPLASGIMRSLQARRQGRRGLQDRIYVLCVQGMVPAHFASATRLVLLLPC